MGGRFCAHHRLISWKSLWWVHVARSERKSGIQACLCCFNSFNSFQSILHFHTSISHVAAPCRQLLHWVASISCIHNSFPFTHGGFHLRSLFTWKDTTYIQCMHLNATFLYCTLAYIHSHYFSWLFHHFRSPVIHSSISPVVHQDPSEAVAAPRCLCEIVPK